MPVLFDQVINGDHYKVVQAGNSVRLYSIGLFHSQYNHQHVVSGALWDLLLLPALLPPTKPNNALVLGVGGGAVIKMLEYFCPNIQITGVDINATHLALAEQFFKVSGQGTSLVCADVKPWLLSAPKTTYDYIVDDVFGGCSGDPQRPFEPDEDWLQAQLSRLSDHGVLVINLDRKEYVKPYSKRFAKIFRQFDVASAWEFECPGYENRILALSKAKTNQQQLLANLSQHPKLNRNYQSCRLQYSVSRCNFLR